MVAGDEAYEIFLQFAHFSRYGSMYFQSTRSSSLECLLMIWSLPLTATSNASASEFSSSGS